MDKTLKLNSNEEAIALYGSLDENLRFAEKEYGVRISARNQRLKISGDKSAVEHAYRFFVGRLTELRQAGKSHHAAHREKKESSQSRPEFRQAGPAEERETGATRFFHRGKIIQGRGKNQEKYLAAIRDHDIVLGIGPAGTGKTYLAMAAAIDYLKKKLVSRIIMARPAVEAGESLGFLPGDMAAKVNPYLRPLYDALYEMMDYEEVVRGLDRGIIEVAPLAYMRGRTLNGSFVILDEAQNCTPTQMKMFLTRLGQSSKAVVTGDITQIDLPPGKKSGLVEAQTVLGGVNGIRFVYFDDTDVVRHPLVQEVIKAYERYDRKGPH
ncbi:MAG TPA: PhoH family protein [bacterium]|nr:PhoH family protein [bacterium]